MGMDENMNGAELLSAAQEEIGQLNASEENLKIYKHHSQAGLSRIIFGTGSKTKGSSLHS